jgi:formiminotetrahydrofolate cyclodeaminase
VSQSTSVWDMSLASFRDAVAVRSTPGCGAAATAAADFGLALVLKGLRISESGQHDHRRIILIDKVERLLEELGSFADKDVSAFKAYMEAVHLPKSSGTEESQRRQAINDVAVRMNEVPLETAQVCLAALELAAASLSLTASNLRSDVIAGGLLLHSGLSSVLLNVDANLSSLHGAKRRDKAEQSRKTLQQEADRKVQWLRHQATDAMSGPASR